MLYVNSTSPCLQPNTTVLFRQPSRRGVDAAFAYSRCPALCRLLGSNLVLLLHRSALIRHAKLFISRSTLIDHSLDFTMRVAIVLLVVARAVFSVAAAPELSRILDIAMYV